MLLQRLRFLRLQFIQLKMESYMLKVLLYHLAICSTIITIEIAKGKLKKADAPKLAASAYMGVPYNIITLLYIL